MNKIIHMVAAPVGLTIVFDTREEKPVLCIALMEDSHGDRFLTYMVGEQNIMEADAWGTIAEVAVRG